MVIKSCVWLLCIWSFKGGQWWYFWFFVFYVKILFSSIHVISPYFGGSYLYFAHFWENLSTKISEFTSISYTSPYLEFQVSLPKFPSLFNHSPYLKKKISLFVISNVSHVCFPVKYWCYPSKMKWEPGNNFEKVVEKTSSKWQKLNMATNTSCYK